MIDMGVASPRAQGHAMMRTATADDEGVGELAGPGPTSAQTMKATMATTITMGTNQPETLSAMRWIGARERWASATICDDLRASYRGRPSRRASPSRRCR
jgi:hypothetical protein